MADNPTPDPAPISREEFDALKDQMAEIALMIRETLKLKKVAALDDPLKDDQGTSKDIQGTSKDRQEAIKNDQGTSTENRFILKDDQGPRKDDQDSPKLNRSTPKKFILIPEDKEEEGVQKKIKQMEEAIKTIKGIGSYGSVNYSDLCVFPGARYPEKFKIPEFEKYNGSGDPYTHLKVYIGELGAYAEDESLRMQLFQKSLTGEARTWYARLDNTKIHSWEELAHTFLTQYSFQSQMAPDRYQMTKIGKQRHESFRDYAQRWRGMAAQVNPPMSEAEMVTTFIDIQEAPYYERVMVGIGKPFAEMIKHGEMAEMGLKSGKIRDFTALEAVAEQIQSGNYGSTSRRTQNRKEEDVSLILQGHPRRVENRPPIQMTRRGPGRQQVFPNQKFNDQTKFEGTQERKFTPLEDPLESILAVLVAQKKITGLLPPANPGGKHFDPSKKCAYHSGSPGHDTQECWSLKHKIQNMIDHGEIIVEQHEGPNVNANPLPEHKAGGVGMIEMGGEEDVLPQNYIKKMAKKGQGQVNGIIKEIPDANPPFISCIPADLTTANWTMEPVASKRG